MSISENIKLVDSLNIDEMTKGVGTVILNFLNFVEPKIYIYQVSDTSITLEVDNLSDKVKNLTLYIEQEHLEIIVQCGDDFYINENANIEDVSVTFSSNIKEIKKRFNKI